MAVWVFGYGSLIWKAGFSYDERLIGFIRGYRRVFYQGSTDHRGTPEFPGRTVTLEPLPEEICVATKIIAICSAIAVYTSLLGLVPKPSWAKGINARYETHWGVAYKLPGEEDEKIALSYLEIREKQYDMKVYVDFFTDPASTSPAIDGVMVYIASPNKETNQNYLGPASLEEMASQIIRAEGPSGPNRDYLFQLENALNQIGCEDLHIRDLANEVRRIIQSQKEYSD